MTALAAAVFLASLLGSAHCAGMCGPFVCFYAGAQSHDGLAGPVRLTTRRVNRWSHAAYNGGRLVTYLTLGAITGALGMGVDLAGNAAGVARLASLAAGVMMIAWGVGRLLSHAGVRTPTLPVPAVVHRRIASVLKAVADAPDVFRAFVTGLTTTLIPCGWLYTFLIVAAGTAGPIPGSGVMLVFWLGTLPMMVALGVGMQYALGPIRRRLPLVSAAVLVIVGLLTVAGRLSTPPLATARHAMHAGGR